MTNKRDVTDLSKPELDPQDPMASARLALELIWQQGEARTLQHWHKAFWEWTGTHYREASNETVKAQLWHLLGNATCRDRHGLLIPFKPNVGRVNNVFSALKAAAHVAEHIRAPAWLDGANPFGILACRNGLLDLPNGKLQPHNPRYFNLFAAPVDFDPAAPEPRQWLARLAKNASSNTIERWPWVFGSLLMSREISCYDRTVQQVLQRLLSSEPEALPRELADELPGILNWTVAGIRAELVARGVARDT